MPKAARIWDLLMRIAEHYEVRFAPGYLVGYRQNDGMSPLIRGMIHSFEIVRRRARQRNPQVNRRVFRLAVGPFLLWLGGRCYNADRFGRCIFLMVRAVESDLTYLLNKSVYRLFIGSSVRLIIGPHWRRSGRARPDSRSSVASMFPPFRPSDTRLEFCPSRLSRVVGNGLRCLHNTTRSIVAFPSPMNRSLDSPTAPSSLAVAEATDYLLVLRANQSWLKLDYTDCGSIGISLKMLVRRDLLARYRQTILGPIWFLLNR